MDIQIRKAETADLDLLMQWRAETLREVFADQRDAVTDELLRQNRAYYEQALPAGRHIACFALADGEIVGCGGLCLYRELPSPDNPGGNCGYLMNIYCRSAYRRQGVGSSVVSWLIQQAKARNVSRIFLEASEDGRKLYEHIGFSDMPDMMEYCLTNGAEKGTV